MEDEIFSLEKNAMERWRSGDPMGFAEISAQDICYIDPGLTKPITGLENYRANLKQAEGLIHYQGSEFIEPKLVYVGDATLLTYNYRSSILNEMGVVSSQTLWNTTEVYFKRQDEWKIVHSHWSYVKHQVRDAVEVPIPVFNKPVENDGILGELMVLERGAMERWRKGDPWGYLDLYSPDMTYMDPGTPQRINGKEGMVSLYKQLEGKIFYDVMDFVDPMVFVSGDLAVLIYRFFSTWLEKDGSVTNRTPWNCTVVYRRTVDGWKVIHNHWSLINGEKIQQ